MSNWFLPNPTPVSAHPSVVNGVLASVADAAAGGASVKTDGVTAQTLPDGTLALLPGALAAIGGLPVAFAATGAPAARQAAARAADSFNALDWGLVCDGVTDNTAAHVAIMAAAAASPGAMAGGRADVVFPNVGPGYAYASRPLVPAGVRAIGMGRPRIVSIGASAGAWLIASGNVEVRNFLFDGQYPAVTKGAGSCIVINNATGGVLMENLESVNGGGITVNTSYGVHINRFKVTNSSGHGVILTTCYDCEVTNSWLQACTYFGIILSAGCYRNLIAYNTTTQNAIELVGVTEGCYENRIIGNHAENTGDNGISVTGFKNVVSLNIVKGCQGNGIQLYGERNTCGGNTCLNNAQGWARNAGWRAGIAIQGAFGGTGQYNVVSSNVIDDEQATPTQQYGVWIGNSSAYAQWAAGQTIAVGAYRYYGLNLYYATTAGTTGSTPPTWTNATATSDGGVTWLFKRPFSAGSIASDYNEVSSNMIRNVAAGRYLDASGGSNNEFIGGRVPVVLPNPLIAAQISNPGGVGSISAPATGAISNGPSPTIAIAAPTGAGGGQQATAVIASFILFGFGNIANGGSGYAVNDVLTLQGGTPINGNLRTVKVTSVDANGAITGRTAGAAGDYIYTALPPAGNQAATGGAGTGATFTSPVWHINAVTVTAPGSNYTSVPAVTCSPSIGATPVATLNSAMTVNAGLGQIVMDGTGTRLGVAGASGAPVVSYGATVDASGVRVALTGAAYPVPANCSLVRFTQSATIASQTVTMPPGPADGQVVQFVNYAGAITALTFSPAINGFASGGTLAANTGLRARWDATAAGWYREG